MSKSREATEFVLNAPGEKYRRTRLIWLLPGYCICNHQRKFTLQFAGKYRLQPPCKISLQFLNVPVTGATATVNSRNQSFATVITCYDHPKRYDGC